MPPKDKIAILKDRAAMMAQARLFFSERDVVEVDCPILTSAASVDAHIDLIATDEQGLFHRFLHTSPEYAMKRLLAEGSGDIYQLGHVFRRGEYGKRHNPEFMMAEWYRCSFTFEQMVEETAAFIRLFLGPLPLELLTYNEVFMRHASCDIDTADASELCRLLKGAGAEPYAAEGVLLEKEELANQLLAVAVEPLLGNNCLTAIWGYPKEQAALARTRHFENREVAERFEIYYKGIELCNGYHELTDSCEQRRRFVEANKQRVAMKKEALPIDERFLAALEKGVPDCCGVAVGFDRLMMLRHGFDKLSPILPFSWEQI